MALTRYTIDGHGVVELNNVAFRRDGRIEAQCFLDTDSFSETTPAENGMLLAIDRVNRKVKVPTDNSLPIALNYTAEHIYDERTPGLKNYATKPGSFLPRLGYLAVGDTFTTNCLAYESTEFTDDDGLDAALANITGTAAAPLYGRPCANGAIEVVKTRPTVGIVLGVVEDTTMPDGQHGVRFHVYA